MNAGTALRTALADLRRLESPSARAQRGSGRNAAATHAAIERHERVAFDATEHLLATGERVLVGNLVEEEKQDLVIREQIAAVNRLTGG